MSDTPNYSRILSPNQEKIDLVIKLEPLERHFSIT